MYVTGCDKPHVLSARSEKNRDCGESYPPSYLGSPEVGVCFTNQEKVVEYQDS
jgi:hypothetical protein